MGLELITPTQFIRQAALSSGTILLTMGKSVTYNDLSLADTNEPSCYLCGGKTGGKGKPVKQAILPTFTDQDKARFPLSTVICPGCAFCLSFRQMRNYSIVAMKDRLIHPDRPTLRNYILEPPNPPFVICVAVSGQKHVHIKSAMSYSQSEFFVQMEDIRVTVNATKFADILATTEQLYTVFSKEEMLTGRYNQNRIKQFGLSDFQKLEQKLAMQRGRRQFELAIFVAQKPDETLKPKEEKQECIITSIPTNTQSQLGLF